MRTNFIHETYMRHIYEICPHIYFLSYRNLLIFRYIYRQFKFSRQNLKKKFKRVIEKKFPQKLKLM